MRTWMVWIAAVLVGPAATARAQDEPVEEPATQEPEAEEPAPEEQPATEEVGLSAEDLAAIEAATSEDAAALEESGAAEAADSTASAGSTPRTGGATQSLNPDLSFIADVAGAWFTDQDQQLQTGDHDPTHNGFNLQQLELSVSSTVDPYFRFDANIVFQLDGVEIEEAYATTLDLPGRLQVRAGQFLTRFGRLNATHPHTWHFVDQPFALGRVFGGEGNRGLGLEASWLTPLPWYVELVGSMTDAFGEGSARSFYGDSDRRIEGPRDFQYTAALKQFFPLSDDWSLYWGVSGAFGPNATGTQNYTQVYGTDLYLKWRPITYQSYQQLVLQAEWMLRRRQVPGDVLSDVDGYAYLFWRFARRWGAGVRYEYGSSARGQDGQLADDYLDPEWIGPRHRVTAAATFWPTEFSRLRLQGSVDHPRWLDEPVWAAFLQAEFVTGAHGAHQF